MYYIKAKLALYGLGFFPVTGHIKFVFVSLGNEPSRMLHVHECLGNNGLEQCFWPMGLIRTTMGPSEHIPPLGVNVIMFMKK